jgi:hypothetical protein
MISVAGVVDLVASYRDHETAFTRPFSPTANPLMYAALGADGSSGTAVLSRVPVTRAA